VKDEFPAMEIIGLTGGICSGKTQVLQIFTELGAFTLKADDLAKQIIFIKNSPVSKEIVSFFGKKVLDGNNGIDKNYFSKTIFSDPEKRAFVNELVHPLVDQEKKKRIKEIAATGLYSLFVYESALMVENDTFKSYRRVIVAFTSPEEQERRLMLRDGISRAEAKARIQAQFPLKEKLKIANYIIDTSGSFEQTRTKTCEVFHLLQNDLGLDGDELI